MITKRNHWQWPAVALVVLCLTGAALADYPSAIGALGPEGYWRLGESSGPTAADASGYGLDGTYTGAVTLGQPGALLGDPDTAAGFGGAGYVEIPHDDRLLLTDGSVLLCVRPTAPGQTAGLLSKDSAGYDYGGHLSVMLDGGSLSVRLQGLAASHTVSGGPLAVNAWHYVAFTFGAGGMRLYVDGAPADNDPFTGGLWAPPWPGGNLEPIVLAANAWKSGDFVTDNLEGYFHGLLDEVVILDRALTPTEVAGLYQQATVPEPASLIVLAAGWLALARRKRPGQAA